jgi:cation diffusion facilitator family transporter
MTAPPSRLAADQASRITRATAFVAVGVALVLAGLKTWAWLASGSAAMLATLADSGLDLAASLFTLWAVTYAASPADAEHRHGHGKAEGFAALMQAALILVSVAFVLFESARRAINPQPITAEGIALTVMVISIVLTFALVQLQTWAVKKTSSVATAGDRAHYGADLATNIAVLIGLGASVHLGWHWADPVAGFLVALWLGKGAFDVAKQGIDQLMDRELSAEERAAIINLALQEPGIMGVHHMRTRASGPFVHVQFHADMDPALSLAEAHAIMVRAEEHILTRFPAADVLIHPDPIGLAELHGQAGLRVSDQD